MSKRPETYFPYDDAPYDCESCLQESVDPIDSPKYEVTSLQVTQNSRGRSVNRVTKTVCSACVESCNVCGELVESSNDARLGLGVHYREMLDGGRLKPAHAICAGTWLIGRMAEAPCLMTFDLDDYTREEIAAFVAGRMKAIAEVAHA